MPLPPPGEVRVLDKIPVDLHADDVLQRIRMRSDSQRVAEMVRELITLVSSMARPKAMYRSVRIDAANGDQLEIEGVGLECHALRVFDRTQPVFPYVATCGQELEAVRFPTGEAMKTYCLTIIQSMVVAVATSYLQDCLVRDYALPQISSIGPGHPESWPLAQRKALFALLGNVEEAIGVKLTESGLMMPVNSVCGIFYPTATRLERCHVCPSETCRERRTAYNPSVLA